jgi:hypothetical protein
VTPREAEHPTSRSTIQTSVPAALEGWRTEAGRPRQAHRSERQRRWGRVATRRHRSRRAAAGAPGSTVGLSRPQRRRYVGSRPQRT